MKTQIIQLEPHDDITSVKDKMEWGQTPRILLVWPLREQILNRRLDLVFLKRHSISLGAQLALVTRDSTVRKYANMLDIPIYPSIRKAEMSHWRSPRRKRKTKKHSRKFFQHPYSIPKKKRESPNLEALRESANPKSAKWLVHPMFRLTLFTLGVLGVLAIAAVLVPSAEVKILPKTQNESLKILLVADPDIESVDLSGKIPVRMTSVIVEGRGEIKTSGNLSIPGEKAIGRVIFTNLTDRELIIPKGTIVSTLETESVRFQTMAEAEVQPKAESGIVPIEAVLPGKDGNVPLNTIIAIEGPLGLDLTVSNPGRTSLGSDQTLPAPDEGDYQNLLEEMLATLKHAAIEELEGKLAENDLLLENTPVSYEIIQEDYSPANSQPADVLSLTLRVEFFANIATGDDILTLGESILWANAAPDLVPDPSTLVINHLSQPKTGKDGIYTWNIQVQWEANPIINEADIISKILWQTPDIAMNLLLETEIIDPNASITLTPRWWPRLPILPFRLHVTESF